MPQEPEGRVSLAEIARQMRAQQSTSPAQREIERETPVTSPQPPAPTSAAAGVDPVTAAPQRTGLRALARAHRLQIVAFLVAVAAFFAVIYFSDPIELRSGTGFAPSLLLTAVWLNVAATGWLIWRLYRWTGLLVCAALGIATIFSPYRLLISFIAFVAVNAIASRRLRKAGAKVGLLGASPTALPE